MRTLGVYFRLHFMTSISFTARAIGQGNRTFGTLGVATPCQRAQTVDERFETAAITVEGAVCGETGGDDGGAWFNGGPDQDIYDNT